MASDNRLLTLFCEIPRGQDGDGDTAWKSVRDIHPPGQIAVSDSFLESDSIGALYYDPVLLEQLTGDLVGWTALHTHGAAGPSDMDAYAWRQLGSSFCSASVTLWNGLAAVACCLGVNDVDSAELMAFAGCRCTPLDKKPGV